MSKYKLDYFSKYYFYEEDDFVNEVEEGKYILEQIKTSNRFDYKGHSYKYTKFGNISQSDTKRDVDMEIVSDSVNVIIDNEKCHLDLIYKFETKVLEDHVRVTTRISEKNDDVSCLLYINNSEAKECIKELEEVKKLQESYLKMN
ncbi:MAG: hypothetical protein E6356_08155 [Terrisporobacter othiniensis]|uniref:Uncharacterized protein n=1 Tax=Terrisporobacter petrolearius TaxID=1460447 RepID=A0ABZ3FEW6_9FIRM|nr:hypothetical protein [Terrisporobacter petrolearius]MDU4861177.1 hypothetical protein [Terrisporobacter othiniensis]MDU6994811.1 hypothetical protein [Terrisporobacter othiniensis]